ncbi:MAG: putative type III restriction system endonuclease [Nitrospira sp.]|jgi:site-specific DNA-methyltransferase (adenine-specific)|nr:putative type III restriction system endonuclease [Nitrospira sp.]
MTAVQGTSAAVETQFLSNPIIAGPGEACTETYLVAGRFDIEKSARRYAAYLRTRFVRFLVSLRKPTQHANRGVYAFVPDIPMNREWTDEKLYERYGLTKNEISFIESVVHPMGPKDE